MTWSISLSYLSLVGWKEKLQLNWMASAAPMRMLRAKDVDKMESTPPTAQSHLGQMHERLPVKANECLNSCWPFFK